MATYIEHGDLWQVLQVFPFSSEVLHGPNYDDMFELVVVEVGRPEGHHQVPQTNQGAVRVCKETDHNVSSQDTRRFGSVLNANSMKCLSEHLISPKCSP